MSDAALWHRKETMLMPKKKPFYSHFTILDPDSTVEGKSIAEWTAEEWNWFIDAPADKHPGLDTTGAYQSINNDGPVFFLAGPLTGEPVAYGADDPVEVDEGTPILLPLITEASFPGVIDPKYEHLPLEKAVLKDVADLKDAVTSLFASIDGVAIPEAELWEHWHETGLFSMGPVEEGSLLDAWDILPVGTEVKPAAAAGYWLMLDGLSKKDSNGSDPGDHTL